MTELFDVIIVGGGPAGLASAIQATKLGLRHLVLEKGCITNSIFHFPPQMVFFTTPELLEIGGLPFICEREKPTRNEGLKYYRKVVEACKLNVHQYEEVLRIDKRNTFGYRTQTGTAMYDAKNIVIAIGYYDNPNYIGIPGEDLPHVSHYYTEAHPFFDQDVVVIGGKNSAVEAALDLFRGGARVSLIHRGPELGKSVKYWMRPDIENRFKAGQITPYFNARVTGITRNRIKFSQDGTPREIAAHQVFALTGYHPTMKFFDQLGVIYDKETLRPQYNSETFETNIAGIYLAGSLIAGRQNGEVFIENGRFHGETVMKAIAAMKG